MNTITLLAAFNPLLQPEENRVEIYDVKDSAGNIKARLNLCKIGNSFCVFEADIEVLSEVPDTEKSLFCGTCNPGDLNSQKIKYEQALDYMQNIYE